MKRSNGYERSFNMKIIYLGLGSNLGDRQANIQRAIECLQENTVDILKCSSIIETDPVGGPPQGKYLNAVIKAQTNLSPKELLTAVKLIEKKLGRVASLRDGPRTVDIDILLYNWQTHQTPELTIPHPRMFQRDFVMRPLKEIAPEIVAELSFAARK